MPQIKGLTFKFKCWAHSVGSLKVLAEIYPKSIFDYTLFSLLSFFTIFDLTEIYLDVNPDPDSADPNP
jgi:hypothetical protein